MSGDDLDFQRLFALLPAPCLVLDRQMRIVTATEAYLASVGRTLAELQGRYVFEAFPEEEDRLTLLHGAFQRALGGEENTLVEVPFSIADTASANGGLREVWWTCTHVPVYGADGTIRYMIQNAQDVTRQVNAQRLKDAIAGELQHRVGNILGLVAVIARRTAGSSDDLDDFLRRFDGRIRALAQTHSYLTGNNWDRMTVEKIVSRQLSDYFEQGAEQIAMIGSDIELNATEAQILTLAIHELTTNSVKHGALKHADGRLAVEWRKVGRSGYDLEWREGGIRIETVPERTGFGSLILDEIVPRQLQAEAVREFGDKSFLYRLSVPERNVPG
jgi:PAS domain S-box-containing protein